MGLPGGGGGLPSRKTIVRVRFWIDSSMTSERTRIMAIAWGSEKPSSLRRWTNFRVSKWWSRGREAVLEKSLVRGFARGWRLWRRCRGWRGWCWWVVERVRGAGMWVAV